MKTAKKILQGACGFVLILLLWQAAASAHVFNASLFPTPLQTWQALAELITQNNLYLQIGASMTRYLIGYVIAAVLAVILGLLHGYYAGSWNYVNPLVQFLRPISPIAWMPFIVLWFGIGDIPAEVVIFIAAFFPILLSTVSAVRHIDPVYLKVASNFSFGTLKTITSIVFPAAFPQIMDGFRMACGTAWIFLVAGEMVGAQSGLGFLIVDARNNLRVDVLAATIVVIGILGLAIDLFMHYLEDLVRKRWGLGIAKTSR
ncbi:MAG: ABC transporter permease [Eubacteriales bacterium]|nr:ABC transporter permease [Eubacteriales bacterium]